MTAAAVQARASQSLYDCGEPWHTTTRSIIDVSLARENGLGLVVVIRAPNKRRKKDRVRVDSFRSFWISGRSFPLTTLLSLSAPIQARSAPDARGAQQR